ncbi:unnamed protein product [Brassicogethes aeneus]|uniref:Cuticle protein 19 n=1 Tax=Brassicogethes aeneus TaxID=1431903 RepID=A0A9P0BA83_BRAAE|nr:unnamed protein product [Brassicogethes aeneus]
MSWVVCLAFLSFSVCFAYPKEEKREYEPVYYKFQYGVHDPQTNDIKSHWEHRDGHVVKGEYMLMEADGSMRIVQYTSDPHLGFQAVVKREGHIRHPSYESDQH